MKSLSKDLVVSGSKIAKSYVAKGRDAFTWDDFVAELAKHFEVKEVREDAVARAARLIRGVYKNVKVGEWAKQFDDAALAHIVTLAHFELSYTAANVPAPKKEEKVAA